MSNEQVLSQLLTALLVQLGGTAVIWRKTLESLEGDSAIRWQEIDGEIHIKIVRTTLLEQ